VKTVSDQFLASIPLAANIRYRPGTRLIKIQSDPKVYFLEDVKTLRWIQTEDDAIALYGDVWTNEVRDVPVTFFGDYTLGDPMDMYSLYPEHVSYTKRIYTSPSAGIEMDSFSIFGSISNTPESNAGLYPVPPGVTPNYSIYGYDATTNLSVANLKSYFMSVGYPGWSLQLDNTFEYYETQATAMHFVREDQTTRFHRTIVMAEGYGETGVLLAEAEADRNLFIPNDAIVLFGTNTESKQNYLAFALMGEQDLIQWYKDQALSRGWLFKGEETSGYGVTYSFKRVDGNDWLKMIVSLPVYSELYGYQPSSVGLFSLDKIKARY